MLLTPARKAKPGSIGLQHLCAACECLGSSAAHSPHYGTPWPGGGRPGHTAPHGPSVQSHSGEWEMGCPCGLTCTCGRAHGLP